MVAVGTKGLEVELTQLVFMVIATSLIRLTHSKNNHVRTGVNFLLAYRISLKLLSKVK